MSSYLENGEILDTKLLWGGNRKPYIGKLSNGVTFDDLE